MAPTPMMTAGSASEAEHFNISTPSSRKSSVSNGGPVHTSRRAASAATRRRGVRAASTDRSRPRMGSPSPSQERSRQRSPPLRSSSSSASALVVTPERKPQPQPLPVHDEAEEAVALRRENEQLKMQVNVVREEQARSAEMCMQVLQKVLDERNRLEKRCMRAIERAANAEKVLEKELEQGFASPKARSPVASSSTRAVPSSSGSAASACGSPVPSRAHLVSKPQRLCYTPVRRIPTVAVTPGRAPLVTSTCIMRVGTRGVGTPAAALPAQPLVQQAATPQWPSPTVSRQPSGTSLPVAAVPVSSDIAGAPRQLVPARVSVYPVAAAIGHAACASPATPAPKENESSGSQIQERTFSFKDPAAEEPSSLLLGAILKVPTPFRGAGGRGRTRADETLHKDETAQGAAHCSRCGASSVATSVTA